MAERRMMSKSIIDTDIFLDMPMSCQNLYFHMLLRADDDGFLSNPKSVLRTIGASNDDLKLLIAKRFLIGFESGVVVIKDWRIHNYIRSDRYKPSKLAERQLIEVADNGEYRLKQGLSTVGIPSDNQMTTIGIPSGSQVVYPGKVRLGKDRLGKVNKKNCRVSDETSIVKADIIDYLNLKTGKNYKKGIKSTERLINARLNEGFTLEDFKTVIDKKCLEWAKDSKMKSYLRPQTLFSTKFESYLNQEVVKEKDNRIDQVIELMEEYEQRGANTESTIGTKPGIWEKF